MSVVRDCVPFALEKHIDLGYEGTQPGNPGCTIMANGTLIKDMVRNLVDNAINYTPSSREKPGVITARVLTDPGPGVPEAERELIFQPFYRALGTEADGSGLGLPIVLEIAHQHHATVTLEDCNPGQTPPGARFVVRFTACPAEETEA